MNTALISLIPVLIQYGVPYAEKLFTMITAGKDPTAQDWADLKKLEGQTSSSQMTSVLQSAGIDPASDLGKALLALV